VLADLTERGIAHIHFDELFDNRQLWNHLSATVHRWVDSKEVKDKEHTYKRDYHKATWKEYIVRLYGNGSTIPWNSPLLSLGIQQQILDIVNSYLGMMSKMLYVDAWNTIALARNNQLIGSQRWHRDPEDIKLVKVFLYFSDVNLHAGPMYYIPHCRKGEKYGHLWPQEIPSGSVPPPEDLEKLIPCSEWEVCTYPAGTFIFVDTTGFHKGGRATHNNRVFATWTFVSPGSLWPRVFKIDPLPDPNELSIAARFALT
jgi:hypothetical protein